MDKNLRLSPASFLKTAELVLLKFSKKGHPKSKAQSGKFQYKRFKFFQVINNWKLSLTMEYQAILAYNVLLIFRVHIFPRADGTSGKCLVTAFTETNSSSTFSLAEHA